MVYVKPAKVKLAIDLDNVIFDFFNPFVKYCKENSTKFNDALVIKALVSGFNYRFDEEYPEFTQIFIDYTNEWGHGSSPLIQSNMKWVFYEVFKRAPSSCFITSRPLKCQIETESSLIRQFDVLKNAKVYWSSKEYQKAAIIKDLGNITHFVDDQTAYITEVLKTNPEVICLWFNAYGMPSEKCPKGASEVNTWEEVLDIIK